jgi:hypothetical protein
MLSFFESGSYVISVVYITSFGLFMQEVATREVQRMSNIAAERN